MRPRPTPTAISSPSPATATIIRARARRVTARACCRYRQPTSSSLGLSTPKEYQSLNNGDTDFGSGGAMLIPVQSGQTAPPMAVGMGKAGVIYLLNASNLGGLEGHKGSAPLQKINTSSCWCGPAYYVGPSGGIVFYQGSGDVVRAYSVATGGDALAHRREERHQRCRLRRLVPHRLHQWQHRPYRRRLGHSPRRHDAAASLRCRKPRRSAFPGQCRCVVQRQRGYLSAMVAQWPRLCPGLQDGDRFRINRLI